MKKLLTGNEAVARGVYEAGITFAAAYPGTPSTEILENIAPYKEEIIAEWAPNEKVALESAIGASIVGARAFAAMKQVGVNVAADPLFSFAYTGCNGGIVLVSADEPGIHSSQNEQDNRMYAKFAKIPMLEPSNSQEAKDMVKDAIKISEMYDTIVLLRMTTRICHSKSLVELGEREEVGKKPYNKNPQKYATTPAYARKMRVRVEERIKKLKSFTEETPLNYFEWNKKKIGIISSGVAYQHAKEVFGKSASYLKLGFTFPLPMEKIKAFAAKVQTLYVIEEVEPYMEEQIKAMGIKCIGKEKIPNIGELNADIIRKGLLEEEKPLIECDTSDLVGRPPTLCAGCPHRGLFYELSKKKNIIVTGDIGCYGLGVADPLNAVDTVICMGASVSAGHGAQKALSKHGDHMRAVSVIGDSTFFHTGMNSLLDIAYNQSNTVTVILDNRTTGMTGHQENPGTGYTLQGEKTKEIDIPTLCRAIGIDHVKVVNPLKLEEVKTALNEALNLDEPSVIITRWPCVLKKHSDLDIDEFGDYKGLCEVDKDQCIGCKKCINTGCPALHFDKESKTVKIDKVQCVGCEVCVQVCPVHAIKKVGE
ncbi:indolepyruvate ferredoxin oxidoreductase subunit alpha [Crassaminicella profunda]|uniref:indolepyruvate ferredoxin oxidoreductase subunit alpha n=1 Tax=Crassaminicella profunda TaxID=1286698 RepID=UPI001CA6C159|nr:indolepyruvate ferredoxin oxidoreductase subunit alpha [Crassaminicella profunda]QZY56873.1 indolepyruvate ferredoxin oxidoreductase subunit alpha [Crassaminicella profunda]